MTEQEIDDRIATALERVAKRIAHEVEMDREGGSSSGDWVCYALLHVAREIRNPSPEPEPDRGPSVYQPESRTENHLP